MPFQSESQRRYMWMAHPDIAKRWSKLGKNRGLPRHKGRGKRTGGRK